MKENVNFWDCSVLKMYVRPAKISILIVFLVLKKIRQLNVQNACQHMAWKQTDVFIALLICLIVLAVERVG